MEIEIEKIVRTKRRKTISLQITDDATLVIRAPFNVSEQTIRNLVAEHMDWVIRKKQEILSRNPKFVKKEFVNGEGFLYMGKYYRLTIVDTQYDPLLVKGDVFFLSRRYLPIAREVFISWYKRKAYEKISERVQWYAKKRGFYYNRINITNALKRWGSCSFHGNLNFSWRLIMAPLPVIDYVVVHELVHLEERNHTRLFWGKVKMLMPDYKRHKDWLKKNGYLLKL